MDRSEQRSPTELASSHLVAGLLREGELSPNIAREMLDKIDNPGTLALWERELNVYILLFDFEKQVVRLDDDLDTSTEGTLFMTIDETRALLEEYVGAEVKEL